MILGIFPSMRRYKYASALNDPMIRTYKMEEK
jgi:hypothetical protein